MRESIKEFVKICAETLPIIEPVYEFGSFQVPGQEGFADLRPFFKGKKYIGTDVRDGPGVDVLVDLHNINLPADSVCPIPSMNLHRIEVCQNRAVLCNQNTCVL